MDEDVKEDMVTISEFCKSIDDCSKCPYKYLGPDTLIGESGCKFMRVLVDELEDES